MTTATSVDLRPVFVGVDGSEGAEAALRFAAELATKSGNTLIAIHACGRPASASTHEEYLAFLADRKTLVEDTWVRPVIGGVEATVEVHQCDPRDISYIANDENAAILVLGRTGSDGGPGFLHLGSVVEHAAHHSALPLAVIPSDAEASFARIAIGVDGSSRSAAAIAWCNESSLTEGADVAAVLVNGSPSLTSPDDDLDELKSWTSPLRDAGATVRHVVQHGKHPADGLLSATAEHNSSLLVLGTRGRGGFLGLRIGGVALKVLHRITLPLVLVPPRPKKQQP